MDQVSKASAIFIILFILSLKSPGTKAVTGNMNQEVGKLYCFFNFLSLNPFLSLFHSLSFCLSNSYSLTVTEGKTWQSNRNCLNGEVNLHWWLQREIKTFLKTDYDKVGGVRKSLFEIWPMYNPHHSQQKVPVCRALCVTMETLALITTQLHFLILTRAPHRPLWLPSLASHTALSLSTHNPSLAISVSLPLSLCLSFQSLLASRYLSLSI